MTSSDARILIVGGGMHTALRLEGLLRPGGGDGHGRRPSLVRDLQLLLAEAPAGNLELVPSRLPTAVSPGRSRLLPPADQDPPVIGAVLQVDEAVAARREFVDPLPDWKQVAAGP